MKVNNAPIHQDASNDKWIHSNLPNGNSAVLVRYEIPYATGTRTRTVVNNEIHIGVTVSPAPRITPDKL